MLILTSWALAALLGTLGAVGFYGLDTSKLDLTPIEQLQVDSKARLEGTLRGKNVLKSPTSTTPCAAWYLQFVPLSSNPDIKRVTRREGPDSLEFTQEENRFLISWDSFESSYGTSSGRLSDLSLEPADWELEPGEGYKYHEFTLVAGKKYFVTGQVESLTDGVCRLKDVEFYPGSHKQAVAWAKGIAGSPLYIAAILAVGGLFCGFLVYHVTKFVLKISGLWED